MLYVVRCSSPHKIVIRSYLFHCKDSLYKNALVFYTITIENKAKPTVYNQMQVFMQDYRHY